MVVHIKAPAGPAKRTANWIDRAPQRRLTVGQLMDLVRVQRSRPRRRPTTIAEAKEGLKDPDVMSSLCLRVAQTLEIPEDAEPETVALVQKVIQEANRQGIPLFAEIIGNKDFRLQHGRWSDLEASEQAVLGEIVAACAGRLRLSAEYHRNGQKWIRQQASEVPDF